MNIMIMKKINNDIYKNKDRAENYCSDYNQIAELSNSEYRTATKEFGILND